MSITTQEKVTFSLKMLEENSSCGILARVVDVVCAAAVRDFTVSILLRNPIDLFPVLFLLSLRKSDPISLTGALLW